MSEDNYSEVGDAMIDGAEKRSHDPCPVCQREKRDHNRKECVRCLDEIDARARFNETSNECGLLGAVSYETLLPRWWRSDPAKEHEAFKETMGFLNSDYHSLYLWGVCGTGKTYAARCILNEAMKAGSRVVDINGVALARILRQQYNIPKLVQACRSFSVVLIDDIDKAFWKEREIEGLWEIFDERYDFGLKTIITSNIQPKEFREMISDGCGGNQTRAESIIQRLQPCLRIEFKGESLR